MRKPRVLGSQESNFYHVMSRVVNRDFIFGEEEKEFFRLLMRKLEAFMGVQVLTYCIMSNHWHILLEVPTPQELDVEEVKKRIAQFYSKPCAHALLQEFKLAEESGNEAWLNELKNRYLNRMYDLSTFVKELKERFSKWYNRKNHRKGTLWEERFKSVLIEGSRNVIATMAAYIELNPVRAGLTDDPKEYRFCGYAEAIAGGNAARQGIELILETMGGEASWRQVISQYRSYLFGVGGKTDERRGFDEAKVQEVIQKNGELSTHELLRCRIRYFSDGTVLGGRLFVDEFFERHRDWFSDKRKTGARKLRCARDLGLFTVRDLKISPLAVPG